MYLAIVTKAGIPVKRDIVEEVIRRANERGGVTEYTVRAGYKELEEELEAYAKSLMTTPEWQEAPKPEGA
jgi:transcription initiation factor TFIIIB Brf1 subunit/transcription initiation factor TFIIB